MTDEDTDLALHAKGRLGTVLRGKYRLDALLGVGGMAVVYKATHRNQAEFAVKMLHPTFSMHAGVKQRFLREGYAANTVKHPGAVAVVDDDVAEDGAAFLVMELLDGSEVESYWARRGGRVALLEACSIVSQLLDVLAAAHAKGIIHRDIKPANLFITRDGTVKVLDFGIARARDAATEGGKGTATGVILGTPAFMAPEQVLAQSKLIDGQSDVWAAGATLFTLVSGQCVHEGENASQIMVRAATTPARPVVGVAPHVPPGLAAVIDRALAFEKVARWATADAMRDALDTACRATLGQAPSKAVLAASLAASAPPVAFPEPAKVASAEAFSATVDGSGATRAPAYVQAATPRLPGRTTAEPVAHERASAAPTSGGTSWVIAAVLVVFAIAAGVALDSMVRGRSSNVAAGSAPSATASVPEPPPGPSPPSPVASATPPLPLPLPPPPPPSRPAVRSPVPPHGASETKQNPLDLQFK